VQPLAAQIFDHEFFHGLESLVVLHQRDEQPRGIGGDLAHRVAFYNCGQFLRGFHDNHGIDAEFLRDRLANARGVPCVGFRLASEHHVAAVE
jgi:hypothetical protein